MQAWQGGQKKKNQLNSKTNKQKQEGTDGPVKLCFCVFFHYTEKSWMVLISWKHDNK